MFSIFSVSPAVIVWCLQAAILPHFHTGHWGTLNVLLRYVMADKKKNTSSVQKCNQKFDRMTPSFKTKRKYSVRCKKKKIEMVWCFTSCFLHEPMLTAFPGVSKFKTGALFIWAETLNPHCSLFAKTTSSCPTTPFAHTACSLCWVSLHHPTFANVWYTPLMSVPNEKPQMCYLSLAYLVKSGWRPVQLLV